MARLSQYSKDRKTKSRAFHPDLKEFKEACQIFPYNTGLYKYFDVSCETFCAFMDREHYKEEQDPSYHSEYLEALKRKDQRKLTVSNFYKNVQNGDVASNIFAMKLFTGAMEAKDKFQIKIKVRELQLKQQEFLSRLASEFNLDFEQLKKFANKHFKEQDDLLSDI